MSYEIDEKKKNEILSRLIYDSFRMLFLEACEMVIDSIVRAGFHITDYIRQHPNDERAVELHLKLYKLLHDIALAADFPHRWAIYLNIRHVVFDIYNYLGKKVEEGWI
jgi:hypothetical protein